MTTHTSPVQTFEHRADRFTDILGATTRWDAPTPCEGWTARDVVAHVVATQRDYLARMDLDAGPEPDLADPAAAWSAHRAHVSATVADDAVAGREYDGYFGRTTVGDTLADFYGWDLVVHGGDVARATGQAWSLPGDEVEAMHATADGWGEALHSEGVCGPPLPVPDDASPTDRLLARLGRDPRWRPAA